MKLNIIKKSVSEQIAAHFRAEIERGKYKPGDPFPSERQLEAKTGISRKTINKAISILAGQGYVFKEQGKSTFVSDFREAAVVAGENNLAFVFDTPESMYHPHCAPLFRALCGLATREGYGTKIIFEPDAELSHIRKELACGNIRGLFVFPIFAFATLVALDVPFAVFRRIFDDLPSGRYAISYADELDVMRQATRYLVEKKRSRLVFLSGSPEYESEAMREKTFLDETIALKLKSSQIIPTHYNCGETKSAVALMLKLGTDAVIAADDMVARWTVDELMAHEVKVPDDIAVIGFNDMEMYSRRVPELTTFSLPYEKIAANAFSRLVRLIAGGKAKTSVAKYRFRQGFTA
ncbi:MAG: GntR family transcriptional regulator [Victivallales bacterium]